jgi:hypothetical protein
METNYKLSLLIAKAKKRHTNGQRHVWNYTQLSALNTVFCAESQEISLQNNTVKHHIDELREDTKTEVLEK